MLEPTEINVATSSAGMFAQTEIKKPNFMARLLVNRIDSENAEGTIELKPFSHFTLVCTHADEPSIVDIFERLALYLRGPLTLKADEVVNLGSDSKPLWAVRLGLGENPASFRTELSRLFDDIMCHEMNSVRYLWGAVGDQESKCPHITIGPNISDRDKAQTLVNNGYSFTFERMDYKQVGPHDPHVIKELTTEVESSYTIGHK